MLLEQIPKGGEKIETEHLLFKVECMDKNRIEKVRIYKK